MGLRSFYKPRLHSKISCNATCPVNQDICRNSDGNIMLETTLNKLAPFSSNSILVLKAQALDSDEVLESIDYRSNNALPHPV